MHVLAPREVAVRRVSERSISAMVDCYLSLNNNLLKSCHSPGTQSSQVLIRHITVRQVSVPGDSCSEHGCWTA
jgi:hypothetical protein